MNCHEVLESLSAWADGELSAAPKSRIDAHLATCEACRMAGDEMRRIGDALSDELLVSVGDRNEVTRRFLASVDGAAPREEAGETAGDSAGARPGMGRRSRDWAWYLGLLVSAAAGFLLAWAVFGIGPADSSREANSPPSPRKSSESTAGSSRVGDHRENTAEGKDDDHGGVDDFALVNVSLGQIESRENTNATWQALPEIARFRCPPSSELRTQEKAVCELQLANGSIVRLDESSTVRFINEEKIEVVSGQVWCQAGENGELSVSSVEPQVSGNSHAKVAWTAKCVGDTCVVTSVKGQETNVFASKGNVNISSDKRSRSLKRGEMVRIVDGEIVPFRDNFDPVAATRWIHTILKEKGPNNPELNERIRELLVEAGYTKVNFLYEEEIRNLGQHAVLPLLEYLADQQFQDDRFNRRRAARLASDLAPSWVIPQLIEHLDDHDTQVVVPCAVALQRLAGTDLGFALESWSGDAQRRQEVQAAWREWWRLRKDQMPAGPSPGS